MKIEVPHNEHSNDEKTFSVFGTHQLNNKTVLYAPNNTITMQDIGDGKFAYVHHSENEQIRNSSNYFPRSTDSESFGM